MIEPLSSSIRDRYQDILAHINDEVARIGKAERSVRVVVVTKSQPIEKIRAAISAGLSSFGENYVEEAIPKIAVLNESAVEWHMIGHVQSRKAELVAAHFPILHSLDSVKLAVRLDHFCYKLDRIIRVLLEFNVSGEESKFGFPAWNEDTWADLVDPIEQILSLPNLQVSGLMTMPPYFENPEHSRPFFQRLRKLQKFLKRRFPETEWRELSMGTSADFLIAVQEGSTIVRIGQAILGSRTG
jgi:PLP dependent protein